ncbi:MAG: hypothetical protein ACM3ML_09330 [Micromonosporaceae bacterium]
MSQGDDPARPVERGIPMQKVIPPRLVEPYLSGQRTVIAGFVYRAADSALQHPADLYDALDLGYEGSEFTRDIPEIYVLRWLTRDIDTYEVPYSIQMGGDWREKPPFSGSGFTSSRRHVVAEFYTGPACVPVGAEMYRITPAGEEFIAQYDGRAWLRAPREG